MRAFFAITKITLNFALRFSRKFERRTVSYFRRPSLADFILRRSVQKVIEETTVIQLSLGLVVISPTITNMKYKVTKENRPTLKNYGRYKAVAVHEQTVETRQIVSEVCRSTGASRGSVIAVLVGLAEAVGSHLRQGDRVRLDDWGLLKLEIDSQKVENADEFDENRHIRAVQLHFIPESRHGRQPLYHGIRFTRAAAPQAPPCPTSPASARPTSAAPVRPAVVQFQKIPISSEKSMHSVPVPNTPNHQPFYPYENYP